MSARSRRAVTLSVMLAITLATALHLSAATRVTTVHIGGMTCPGCAKTIETALARIDGVKKVESSFEKSRALVTVEDTVSDRALVNAVLQSGYQAGLAEDTLEEPDLLKVYDKQRDVKVISAMGEDIDVTAHLVAGKVTVVDFSATWCLPCRKIDELLAGLLVSSDHLAVRKVNVVEWSSAVAKHYLSKQASLPYLHVYSPDGKLVAEVGDGKLKKLDEIIRTELERDEAR